MVMSFTVEKGCLATKENTHRFLYLVYSIYYLVNDQARNEYIVSLADGPSLDAARVAIESLPDWTVAGVQSGLFQVGFRGPRDLRHMSEAALNNMLWAMNEDPDLPSLPAENFRLVSFVAEGQEGRGGVTGFLEVTADFV